jgi:hypothetical protein
MNIKLEQILTSVVSLRNISEERLPIKTSFKLKKIIKEVDENILIYEESKRELLEKYGEKQDDINYKISEANQEVLENEHQQLIETEVTLGFEQIKAEELENSNISPKDLQILDWLITE